MKWEVHCSVFRLLEQHNREGPRPARGPRVLRWAWFHSTRIPLGWGLLIRALGPGRGRGREGGGSVPWFVFVPKGRCYLSCLTRTTWQANHAAPLSKWGLRVGAAWTQTEVLAKERAGSSSGELEHRKHPPQQTKTGACGIASFGFWLSLMEPALLFGFDGNGRPVAWPPLSGQAAGEQGERRGPLCAVPGECGQEERAPTTVGESSNRTGPKQVLYGDGDRRDGL